MRDNLGDDVELVTEGVGFPRRRTVAKRRADLNLFTAEQIALVDEVIDRFWNYTANEIEAAAHRASVGWQLAEMQEDIPYATALLSPDLPSDETIDFVRQRFTPSAK